MKPIATSFRADAETVIFTGDVVDFLAQVPDNSVALIVTSPPYNLGKQYENRVAIAQYLQTQAEIITQLHRVLRADGSICWQVGNFVENGEVYPLDILYYSIFKELGMKLRNRIIWKFGHGLHASRRFSGRYETILWFSKSDRYKFNLDAVRVPAKYPGKRHFKGQNKGKPSGNPLGKNPSDIWEIVNYSQLKQGAFSSPAVSKLTTNLWGGLQHPQSTVTSALNNRFWCPQYNYSLKQLKFS